MSYWAKIKAAATGSDLFDVNKPRLPQQQAPVTQPPAQTGVAPVATPATPAPTPAPTPQSAVTPSAAVGVGGEQMGGNEIVDEVTKKDWEGNDKLQEPINDSLDSIWTAFLSDPRNAEIVAKHKNSNPKFEVGAGAIFKIPDKEAGGKAWYRLLLEHAKDAIGVDRYTTPQAIKAWLRMAPTEVFEHVKSVVEARPAQFAELIEQFAHKTDSQYGQRGGISMNQQSGESGKQLGDFVDSSKGNSARVNQMEDEGYVKPKADFAPADTEDMANFWTRTTKNQIVAPEASPAEQAQLDEQLKVIVGDYGQEFAELSHHLQNEAQENGAPIYQNIDPAKQQKIFGESLKWILGGISDTEKQASDSPVALSNWQEYMVKHGGMSVEQVVQVAQQAAAGDTVPLETVMVNLGDQLAEPNSPFFEFAKIKATEYMAGANEIAKTNKLMEQSDFRPQAQDIESFRRMAKIAYGCALREYRYKKIHGKGEIDDGSGTALRRGSYVKHKISTIIDKLNAVYTKQPGGTLVPNGKFIPFGEDERDGKQRFLHMGTDKQFYIRTATFDANVPIRNDTDLRAFLKDKPDQAITMSNFSEIASMVAASSYAPKMMEDIQAIDPAGLKKPQKEKETHSELQKSLSQANAEWLSQNPNAPDRLKVWRKQIGGLVEAAVNKAGGVEQVVANIASMKKKGGFRASNPVSNKGWLETIMRGEQGTEYSKTDFQTVAAACKVDPQSIYGEYIYEYDKFNKDNHNAMTANMETAPAVFARYFVHRKRIQKQRGFNEHNWGNKSIAAFMRMNNAHKHFMNYSLPSRGGAPAPEATGMGGPLLDETDNEWAFHDILPGLNGAPEQKITTPEQERELINRMNPRDVPRTDIYKGISRQRPTSPVDEQLRPDGKGGFIENEVEASPIALFDAALKGYISENPDAAELGTTGVLQSMKEEKLQELQQMTAYKQQLVQNNTEDMNDPAHAIAAAVDEIQKSDWKVQGLITELTKKQDFSDEAQQRVRQLAEQRLPELAKTYNLDPQEFAKQYLASKVRQDQAWLDSSEARISQLQSLDTASLAPSSIDPATGKRKTKGKAQKELELKNVKTLLETVVPLRYKTRVHSKPGEAGTGLHPSFKPLDFVHNDDIKPIEDATASSINITVKTADAMDKLAAIRDRLARLSLPTQFVDDMIDNVDREYEQQLTLIARRHSVRRNASNRPANKERRRMWQLL